MKAYVGAWLVVFSVVFYITGFCSDESIANKIKKIVGVMIAITIALLGFYLFIDGAIALEQQLNI